MLKKLLALTLLLAHSALAVGPADVTYMRIRPYGATLPGNLNWPEGTWLLDAATHGYYISDEANNLFLFKPKLAIYGVTHGSRLSGDGTLGNPLDISTTLFGNGSTQAVRGDTSITLVGGVPCLTFSPSSRVLGDGGTFTGSIAFGTTPSYPADGSTPYTVTAGPFVNVQNGTWQAGAGHTVTVGISPTYNAIPDSRMPAIGRLEGFLGGVSGEYTPTSSDHTLVGNTTSSSPTIHLPTLPDANFPAGAELVVKDVGSAGTNNLLFTGSMDGVTPTPNPITQNFGAVTLQSDGAGTWLVTGSYKYSPGP